MIQGVGKRGAQKVRKAGAADQEIHPRDALLPLFTRSALDAVGRLRRLHERLGARGLLQE